MAAASYNLTILFMVSLLKIVAGTGIGISYGRSATNLPPIAQVAQFLAHSTTFDRVKLFDADLTSIRAFANTDLAVDVTVPARLIANLTDLRFARKWVRNNVAAHVDTVNLARVLVGDEVLTTGSMSLVAALAPAMQNLHTALAGLALQHRVKVSAPQSLAVLASSDPPSAGEFRDAEAMRPLLGFLRATGAPFMVNAYPFVGCAADTLGYALFRPAAGGVVDDGTGAIYSSMLEAQLDAVYSAMRRVGFEDVEIAVAETGWPTAGEEWQVGAGADNAREYNENVIRHLTSGTGTPLMPNRTFEAFLFSLFDEDLKTGPASERHFGLFRPDMSLLYDIGILATKIGEETTLSPTRNTAKRWCVPKPNTQMLPLQDNIEYVCGQGINCAPIQPGGACYYPDTVAAHAAFLMNEYYQAFGRNDFDCDFGHTGMITAVDPSSGSCVYSS